MSIYVVEVRRTHVLDNPVKMTKLTQFSAEKDALEYMKRFSENQIIEPSVKAANNVVKKCLAEDYTDSPYTHRVYDREEFVHVWSYQVFMCTISDSMRVIRIYSRISVLSALNESTLGEKAHKHHRFSSIPDMPESQHNIPYKKKCFYEPCDYHSPKNGKLRLRDYPEDFLTYPCDDADDAETIFSVRLPNHTRYYWDSHFVSKYYHHAGHVCWKNYKKNKKQWMKHKPAHAEIVQEIAEIDLDPWELWEEESA